MKKTEVFRAVAKRIIDNSPSEKARDFATKTVESINALGESWVEKNFAALKVCEQDAILSHEDHPFPPEDNRAFFISAWNRAAASPQGGAA